MVGIGYLRYLSYTIAKHEASFQTTTMIEDSLLSSLCLPQVSLDDETAELLFQIQLDDIQEISASSKGKS